MERQVNRTCIISNGRRRLHSTFPNGFEMVEEYDITTDELYTRRIKQPVEIGEGKWELEIGEPSQTFDPNNDTISASTANVTSPQPIFIRKDTPLEFQWRIRNLPYPPDTYSVTIDHERQKIVIRTSNKKYYKVFAIGDLERAGIPLEESRLSWIHQYNTLIISVKLIQYQKPEFFLSEQAILKEKLEEAKRSRGGRPGQEGDIECITQ